MKRNLKFWTRYTWETASAILGLAVIFAVLTAFGAEGLELGLFASVVPYYLCASAVFIMLMINTGSQVLYVPLLLSMGELRRNVLLGFHYYRALIIAVTTALCALIWLLIPGEISSIGLRSIPTILCVLVLAASVGSIMGTVFVKWKWLSFILIIVVCGGAGGVMGLAGVKAAEGFSLGDTAKLASYLLTLPWWLAAAMLALLAADIVFQWLLLRRQEVKL